MTTKNTFCRPLSTALMACSLALSAGCSTTSPDLVSRSQAQQLQQARYAVVESVRAVTVDGTQSGLGAAAGAVAGGLAGSSVGGHREAIAVGVIGAVLGGVLGNAIERSTTQERALEFVLRMDDGSRRVLVQAEGSQNIRAGDRVMLVGAPGQYRLSR